jgi:hypothetical protein
MLQHELFNLEHGQLYYSVDNEKVRSMRMNVFAHADFGTVYIRKTTNFVGKQIKKYRREDTFCTVVDCFIQILKKVKNYSFLLSSLEAVE